MDEFSVLDSATLINIYFNDDIRNNNLKLTIIDTVKNCHCMLTLESTSLISMK